MTPGRAGEDARLRPDERRVCIVLLAGIGDVVHGLPLARAIKEHDPERAVVWVAQPAPAEVLKQNPWVDEVVDFHRQRGLRGVYRLWRDLGRVRPLDVTLNVQHHAKSIFPTVFSRAPKRIGLPPSKVKDGVRWVHTHHLPEGPWKHAQDLYLDFLDVLGVPRPEPLRWEIPLSDEERAEQRAFFERLPDRPVAALVFGSAVPAKDWPPERYVPLTEALERDYGYTVLLAGGPGEAEQSAARRVMEEARAEPVWGLGNSVRRLIWMIGGSDLVISPDTGPLHLAHALEVPVIGLYATTSPARVGPYRRYRDLVIDRYTDPGEEPDPAHSAPRHGRMDRISVEDVLERVERARERYGAGTRRGG